MEWEEPVFYEIRMDAEIGGYQDDFGEREPPERASLVSLPLDQDAPSLEAA